MSAIKFFAEHAGISYMPGECIDTARARVAWELACAEAAAREAGARYQWGVDPTCTSADWCDDEPAWRQWQCALVLDDGDGNPIVQASLGGIDLGPEGEPWSESYARLIEAQLAQECIALLRVRILLSNYVTE